MWKSGAGRARLSRPFASILAALAAGCTCTSGKPVVLEVSAGEVSRRDTVVEWPLPPGLASCRRLRLEELSGDAPREVAVQVLLGSPRRIAFVVEGQLPAGETRRYRLSRWQKTPRGREIPREEGVTALDDGRTLALLVDGQEVLRYNHAPVEPPEGVPPIYTRSGYLHPIRSPAGRVVTGDFPASHRHQHGVFFPWTRTRFEGREVDYWNAAAGQGRVECTALEAYGSGPVVGWLRARQLHNDLTAPDAPRPALDELWEVRVYALGDRRVFDLVSVQSCAQIRPLEVLQYHYGGLGLRGPEGWEGDAATFLTSEGLDRVEGNETRARWCAISGPVAGEGGKGQGATATIAVLCAPTNLRAPQPLRLHPSNPYFCFAPCQLGPFQIVPEHPLVSHYRFVVTDGPPDAELLDAIWDDWTSPLEVRILEELE